MRRVLVLATWLSALPAPGQPSSTSWVLPESTVDGGGGTSASPSGTAHRLTASAGQPATIGTSSSPHFVLQSGFWSFAGSGLVPVILSASAGVVNPDDVDLGWTGNNSPYRVYRSTSPAALYGSPLVTEPGNTYTDPSPAGTLLFYGVLATAPGPIVSPGVARTSPGGGAPAIPQDPQPAGRQGLDPAADHRAWDAPGSVPAEGRGRSLSPAGAAAAAR